MTRTGIFASEKEIEEIRHARDMPCIRIGGHLPETVNEVCHRLALKHGLPDIRGYYGCDLSNGEFVTA